MADAVADVVTEMVAKYFRIPREAVDLSSPIEKAGDSLQLSELVIALEQRFDVTLDDAALARVVRLGDLVALVEERLRR